MGRITAHSPWGPNPYWIVLRAVLWGARGHLRGRSVRGSSLAGLRARGLSQIAFRIGFRVCNLGYGMLSMTSLSSGTQEHDPK